uniref:Protein Wnt n=1 Tax=Aceria tosichella TaxID=561515 RepID=A0A6G1S309_9ACAR
MNLIGSLVLFLIISFSQVIQGEHHHHHQAQAQAWQKQHLNKIQKYLTERQQELVRRNPGSLWAVARAIKIAIKACQYEMRNELWDCPTYGFSVRPSETFGMLMSRNFKETSFVQSLLSAAIAHSVSRACTESIITTCSRKQLPHGNGFGEDAEFGRQFAREFMEYARTEVMPANDYLTNNNISHDKLNSNSIMAGNSASNGGISGGGSGGSGSNGNIIDFKDRHWRERRLRQMINAHNDEVGTLVVLNGMHVHCKCHGISGACSMRTCWKRLPEFKMVAKLLHDSLDKALRVEMYAAPLGSSLMTNRHKSLTSAASSAASSSSSYKKLNKKRSSSSQSASSNLLNGLGRSSVSIGQVFTTTPSLGGTSIGSTGGGSDNDNGAGETVGTTSVNGGRLQAHQELNMNSINNEGAGDEEGGVAGLNTGVDINDSGGAVGGIDKQSSREFAQNTVQYSAMLAAQQQQQAPNTNSTTLKRRPIARSIGPAAPAVTPTKSDLIYAEQSLNYCNPIERYNIKGTKGRICSEKRSDANSCETLCCGRGYKTEIREEKYTCECKFQYCCVLKCNTCTRRKVIHKCL